MRCPLTRYRPAILAVAIALAQPTAPAAAIDSVEVSADEADQTRLKLRQIALAMLNYCDTHGSFPLRADGPGLSWRVRLLPFLDQGPLYKRFHLKEPWNSPANAELLPLMPEVYRSLTDAAPNTHFVTFSGPDTMFPLGKAMRLRDVSDGMSNTILALHAAGTVPWTKPDDLAFDPASPLLGLVAINDRIEMVRVDGGPLALPASTDGATMTALATPRGGEVVDGNGLHRRANPAGRVAPDAMVGTRIAAERRETMNRLKAIVLAAHNCHDSRGALLVPWERRRSQRDGMGSLAPATSWRVAMLPFLEQATLYKRYDRQAEWNDDANLPVLDQMPDLFRHASDLNRRETRVHVIVDNGAAITTREVNGRPVRFNLRRRGTSKTLLFVEAGPETASPWTQPTAIRHRPEAPLEALGTLPATGFAAAMMDGSVRWLTPDIEPAAFRAMVESQP